MAATIVKRFVTRGHSLKAWRVGGLSPVKQARGTTPTRRGIWAWPFSAHDMYYVAQNAAFGKKKTVFWVDGPFYSRIDPNRNFVGAGGVGGWYKWTDAEAWMKMATRVVNHERAVVRAEHGYDKYGVDTECVLEIFIPHTTKIK